MAEVQAIGLPYISRSSRKVDGLLSFPLAINHYGHKDLVFATSSAGGYAAGTAPASLMDSRVELENLLKAICAIFPGDNEATIRRVERPGFTRADIKTLISRHMTDRFDTSETNNFNCLLKELITHQDFMVDQHNYSREGKRPTLAPAAGETTPERLERLQKAEDFENARYDAFRRLETEFEVLKNEVHQFKNDVDEMEVEVDRLRVLQQKLNEEPEIVTQSFNFTHELPPKRTHFRDIDDVAKYLKHPTQLLPSSERD